MRGWQAPDPAIVDPDPAESLLLVPIPYHLRPLKSQILVDQLPADPSISSDTS